MRQIEHEAVVKRQSYRLHPAGPEGRIGGPHRLARLSGRMVGSRVKDRVQIWLTPGDGELIPTMWPGEYRARFTPLVLLNEEGRTVARGGEEIHVVGGFLPPGDPRAVAYGGMFFASRIVRERQE